MATTTIENRSFELAMMRMSVEGLLKEFNAKVRVDKITDIKILDNLNTALYDAIESVKMKPSEWENQLKSTLQ